MIARRRSWKAYLVEPFKQIRFGLYVVAVCLTFVSILGVLFSYAFYQQYQQIIEFFNVADAGDLVNNTVFVRNAWMIAGVLVAFVASMLIVVIERTHRMYGPMISINRFLDEMRCGKYSQRLRTRENDDFQDLVSRLNNLAEVLEARHGSTVGMPENADHPTIEELKIVVNG